MGSCDLLLEFRDTSISLERLKVETSNLACRVATGAHAAVIADKTVHLFIHTYSFNKKMTCRKPYNDEN